MVKARQAIRQSPTARARCAGAAAHAAGVHPRENPYPVETEPKLHGAWERAWWSALWSQPKKPSR